MTVDGDYVELEMDALNQHECMATMVAVVKHMQQNNITPSVAMVGHDLWLLWYYCSEWRLCRI